MPSLITTWNLDGCIDEQRYYCSESTINPVDLPVVKAVLAGDVRTYTDIDIASDKTYYVRIGAVKNGTEKLSAEYSISTESGDPLWTNVNLLLQANSMSYPSSVIVDTSSNGRLVAVSGTVKIINTSTPKYNDGVIYSSGGATNKILANIEAIGAREFTLEAWVKSNASSSGSDALLFGIWTENDYTNGCAVFRDGNTNPVRLKVMTSTGPYDNSMGTAIPSSIASTLTDGEWVHVCLVRAAGKWYLYLDGVKVGTGDFNVSSSMGLTKLLLLRNPSTGRVFAGELNDIRLTNAVRYDVAGFTPPDKEFPTS